ncbi:hypothetical protein L2712_17405 [Shewanella marisflavi]|uniref:hypothetical protein n=1 Tax=Shewanella marisflavi TaxID=260364 RepID=UPI00200BB04C|nr:hypothetical protein [Shewanella marisflavi]MCL1043410.1 hypothetical protein [Shewanella marisflavi]
MKIYVTILIMIFSSEASACRPASHWLKEMSTNSDNAYEGVVTGLINDTLEKISLDAPKEDVEERIVFPYSYTLRVALTHRVRGKIDADIKLSNTFCGNALDIGTKVFYFSNEDDSDSIVLSQEFVSDNYPEAYRKLSNKALKKDAKNNSGAS